MRAMPRADTSPQEADEALMLRYAAGDITAFDALYARHEIGVWRYVFRSVQIAEVADDLLQDVWFAVARQALAYQPTARFKTWLFTLAHNRLVDYFRTSKNHLSMDSSVTADDEDTQASLLDTLAADSGLGPLRQLQSSEQAAALIRAVESLPAVQREAFLLQAEAGMAVEDIASSTGVSFQTAKSRLRYARSSLRRQLQEFA